MITRPSREFLSLAAACFILACNTVAAAQPPAPIFNVKTSGGVTTVTVNVQPGTIRIILPDDIRPGDTISGTLATEPKGQTAEALATSRSQLESYGLNVGGESVPINLGQFTFVPRLIDQQSRPSVFLSLLVPSPGRSEPSSSPSGIDISIPFTGEPPVTFAPPDPLVIPVRFSNSNGFTVPDLAQQGRPLTIHGPFDGNSSNTTLRFGPARSELADFAKNPENVSGGFGLIRPLAESPRKLIFASPDNVKGPFSLMLREGKFMATANSRNLSVRLSAPKTNLMRGEKTTVTIVVSGLEGISHDVPLQLDARGVITMDGGNFQNLRIRPAEVMQDGTYTTTRGITGQAAGGFSLTATVIVTPFDFVLQDDKDPNRLFHFNSFTGDYVFTPGGRPGGAGPPSGAPVTPPVGSGLTLTGLGRPAMKGCLITLSHNTPERRIFARLDTCTKSGDASVETNTPKSEIKITDTNTADNTAGSPGPK